MKASKLMLLLIFIMLTGWRVSLQASELTGTKSSRSCLALFEIDSINIIDDQNIVFKAHNDSYYLNKLPHTCINLDKNKAIMYKTPTNQLCNNDLITVLDTIGGGFHSLGACGLGDFKPVSESEVKLLKENAKKNK